MKNQFVTVLLFALVITLHAQEKSVVRISNPEPEVFKSLLSQGYDVAAYRPGLFLDVVVSDDQYKALLSQGFELTVTQTEKQLQENLHATTELPGYRSYNDLLTELQGIEAANPGICKLYDIGDSRGKEYPAPAYDNYKHEIWAMKISDNVATEEDEPCIFFMGTHHAREPISLEVAMYILNHIVDQYGTDPGITNSVNNKQIWFVPLVNPDGHKIVWDNVDTWWRKNIRDNNNSNTINTGTTDGVDPNRNYDWAWGTTGTSSSSSDITYCGPAPNSEPEIQAMINMMGSHHFVAGITYHSYSELVLFPYGHQTLAFAPDHNSLEDLAISMANTIPAAGGGYYFPDKSSGLYPASGTTDDFAYGNWGIFCYTIELGTIFIPPQSEIAGICEDNLQAAKILLNRVDQSTLTGLVKNANTLDPVVAEVYVEGVDNTGAFREPYESDAAFGRYYRFLQNGNYSVTFSAYGYIPQTFNDVNINGTGQTILDVNLLPAQAVIVSGTVTDFETGLPIEGATIEIMNTPVLPVNTNSLGEYTINDVLEGTYDFRVSSINYATVIQPKNVSVASHIFDFQLEASSAWSFETGVYEPQWTFGGNAPWYITNTGAYDGFYCSRSGAIGNSAISEMSVDLFLSSGGEVSFSRRVSSEAGWDFLRFSIDGVQQDLWSGEVAWGEVVFPVSSGSHTFTWSYTKDGSVSSGSDCAWVDFIVFPPIAPPPDPADIVVDPLVYEVTQPADAISSHTMDLGNQGDLDLSYTITKQYLEPGKAPAAYCTASGGCDEYISRVVLNTLDNNSGTCSGYMDYTYLSTTVDAGLTYDLTITIGAYYTSDDLGVWIDWNQDQDFDDPGENVGCAYSTPPITTFSITVPPDAPDGPTRMRIRLKYSGTDCGTPCGTTTYGEVEDYTVIVNNTSFSWLTVSPSSGTVGGQATTSITVMFDSQGLEEGDYYANLNISSNDPDAPLVSVPCTLHVANQVHVELKVMLEGAFTGAGMHTTLNSAGLLPLIQPFGGSPWNYAGTESVGEIPNAGVTDWVLVELRQTAGDAGSATPSTMVGRQAGFLMDDGSIVDVDGFSVLRYDLVISQHLYAVVYHRNHLGIMSAGALVKDAGTYALDFTAGAGQAHGGAASQKELEPGVWSMIGGNGNGDGTIDMNDKVGEWELQAGKAGFMAEDYNLDGQVDNRDKDDCWVPNLGRNSAIPQ